jgi:hypothetical protein
MSLAILIMKGTSNRTSNGIVLSLVVLGRDRVSLVGATCSADSNAVVAQATLQLFLSVVLKCLHDIGHETAYCFMDIRSRNAMGFPNDDNNTNPSSWLQNFLECTLTVQKWGLRYLYLPPLVSQQRVHYFDNEAGDDAVSSQQQ